MGGERALRPPLTHTHPPPVTHLSAPLRAPRLPLPRRRLEDIKNVHGKLQGVLQVRRAAARRALRHGSRRTLPDPPVRLPGLAWPGLT